MSQSEILFFVLVHGVCQHLNLTKVIGLAQPGTGLMLLSDTVIDGPKVRKMTDTERESLPQDSALIRVIYDKEDLNQAAGEMLLHYCSTTEPTYSESENYMPNDFDSIRWISKRAGPVKNSVYPVFVCKNEIFPGSYIPEAVKVT